MKYKVDAGNSFLPQNLFQILKLSFEKNQSRDASPTPDQKGINSNTLLDHPAAPNEKC